MKPDNRVIKTDAHAKEVDSINKKGSYAWAIILQIQVFWPVNIIFDKLITTYTMRFSIIQIQIRPALNSL